MAETLRIVARMQATPGAADSLAEAMKTLVKETRQEAGCIQYDLMRGTENPDILVFVEEWETHALWQAHMRGEAIARFNTSIGVGKFASGEVMQLEQIA